MDAVAERVQTDPRLRRRRRSVSRSRRRKLSTRAAAIAGVIGIVATVLWSPLLAVRDVKILGARHTTVDELAEALRVDERPNILTLSTAEMERRAETLPWVSRARVDRSLPGTLRVRVVERRPAAVVALGAARWTVDRKGNVLSSGGPKSLPVIAGTALDGIKPGTRLDSPEVRSALVAYASMRSKLAKRVEAIFAPTTERITMTLDGMQVRYGAAERLRAKNAVLRALLGRIGADAASVSYIDVRVPTSPAVGGLPVEAIAPIPPG